MEKNHLLGMYRAKIVDNKDPEKFGRVMIWVPDFMPDVAEDEGLWARPANNPLGGRNEEGDSEHHYMGSSYIPRKGAWVWVFFEGGNINRPYYFGALDLENTKVLPENQLGENYEDKWTIFKSHEGRCIIVSDDKDDCRVEITGKKRQINTPPTGDTGSVYTIDDNQTTILFDERDEKEKILIRTHKGDFFHIDIDDQKLQVFFKEGIDIKTDKSLNILAGEDINLKTRTGDILIQAESSNVFTKAGMDIKQQSGGNFNNKSGGNLNLQSVGTMNELAGGLVNIDGTSLNEQCGSAGPASDSQDASSAEPKGERDT